MHRLKEELKIKTSQLLKVYFFAQEAYLYTEYFHNPRSLKELKLVKESPHSRNLSVIMHMMFRTLIVEVAKLFSRSESDKFRLDKFIASLSSSGHFRKLGINNNLIDRWRKRIEEHSASISDILLIRDKIYAHTDNPNVSYNDIEIQFEIIKSLLDVAKDLLTEIHFSIFNASLSFESPTFDEDRFGLLEIMASGEDLRVKEIMDKFYLKRLK